VYYQQKIFKIQVTLCVGYSIAGGTSTDSLSATDGALYRVTPMFLT